MLVVHIGDRISDRIFHSRVSPSDAVTAVTAVTVPNLPLTVSRASIRRSRLAVSASNSARGRSPSDSRSSSMMPAFVRASPLTGFSSLQQAGPLLRVGLVKTTPSADAFVVAENGAEVCA